ncbi:efflux RND transporter periplasmic adaptor subunit [Shewanella sp. KX20019]|uniref:efflux RND transporter periplasmic adaptor subunit n=1 Tax=Shewanella sp. KX20019 TaxID=2803864 RepID=UPI0019290ABA|nr:efflux RND transporter periplasmic adaptor subunit [Shewanella sp. KX20019]QQX78811.1 efflux RND transporter periplasmic adaptor subunit [Shewanella sp. KX20019]
MKLKPIVKAILLAHLAAGSLATHSVIAQSAEQVSQQVEEKGPNNGRLLKEQDLTVELAIFEDGMPPEFRVFATTSGSPIAPEDIDINVKLTRLGDGIDDINFYAENDYLRGDMEIYEPHSFAVTVTAKYNGKSYQWDYDNFEGRTLINSLIADKMQIITENVESQQFNETLAVFGTMTLAPNAVTHVSARFAGEVKELNVKLGQKVKKGQVLMTIESNESLQPYTLFAPIDGQVTKQNVTQGQQANAQTLLTISDTSKLVAELSVFPLDVQKVQVGAKVSLNITGLDAPIVAYITDSLFELNSDQAKVFRAEVDNRQGLLNAGQFFKAEIALDSYQVPLAVKADGLQSFRDFTVVYAKIGEQYEVRMLELGRKAGPWVEVLSGIPLGTEYVALNSYLIKADIEKSGASHDH